MQATHWRLLAPTGYMAGLFFLSSIPGDSAPDDLAGKLFEWVNPNWQNLLHIPLYAGLLVSWAWSLSEGHLNRRWQLAIAFILTLIWGTLDEIHQLRVPGRYGSLTDLALNALGASVALAYMARKSCRD